MQDQLPVIEKNDEVKRPRRLFIPKPDDLVKHKSTLSLPMKRLKALDKLIAHKSVCHKNYQRYFKFNTNSIQTQARDSVLRNDKEDNPFSFKKEEITIYIPANDDLGIVESDAKCNKKLKNLDRVHGVMCKLFLGEKINKKDLELSATEVTVLVDFLLRKQSKPKVRA